MTAPDDPVTPADRAGVDAQRALVEVERADLEAAGGVLSGGGVRLLGPRAVAVLFAREGADVAFTYLPEEEQDANETRQAVEAAGRRK